MPSLSKILTPAAAFALASSAAIAFTCPSSSTCSPDQSDASRMTSLVSMSAVANSHDDIIDVAVNAGSFNTLATALTEAKLVKTLKGDGPFTVFAPTDDAFAKLPKGTVESLLDPHNREKLQGILTFHVVAGKLDARTVIRNSALTTVNGQRLDITTKGENVFVNGARITSVDIPASNGVIHVIDSVMLPESKSIVDLASEAGSFNTLLAAAKKAGLAETLAGPGSFTVLAPTDDAFAKLPKGTVDSLLKPENRDALATILKYHVVPSRAFARDAISAGSVNTLADEEIIFSIRDGRLNVNGANIVATDLDASNGVVHVIDTVLLPSSIQ